MSERELRYTNMLRPPVPVRNVRKKEPTVVQKVIKQPPNLKGAYTKSRVRELKKEKDPLELDMPDNVVTSDQRLLSPIQAAGYLSVKPSVITKLRKGGLLPFVQLGKMKGGSHYRFRIADLDQIIITHRWDPKTDVVHPSIVAQLLGIKQQHLQVFKEHLGIKRLDMPAILEMIEARLMARMQMENPCPVCQQQQRIRLKVVETNA